MLVPPNSLCVKGVGEGRGSYLRWTEVRDFVGGSGRLEYSDSCSIRFVPFLEV